VCLPLEDLTVSWWRNHFEIYRAPDLLSAQIRGRHLHAVTRLTPVSMAANVLNGAFVCFALWNSVARVSLLTWFALLSTAAGLATYKWWQRRARVPGTASPVAISRATLHAALLGLLWAYVPAAWFAGADPPHQVLIAILTSGMMCAGAFTLATVPTASLIYVGLLAAGSAYALAASHETLYVYVALLLLTYTLVIVSGVLSVARTFTARIVSDREVERQSQMVGLLLRDFEEHASDVLWEIDGEGRFTHVSNRLATLLSSAQGEPAPESLLGLLDRVRGSDDDDVGRETLREALASDRPFRQIVVPLQTREGQRWWSITAKPVTDESGRATGWRGVMTDVTGEKRAQQRLHQLAHCDPLTGLANRMVLRERLGRFVGPAASTRLGGALLFIDLDNFKTINDTLGHSVGDTVLQIVAGRLQSVVRERDMLARLGGDEFAIVLTDAGSVDEVAAIVQRLLRGLAVPCIAQGCSVTLGASVGIALLPEHGSSVDEALGNADLALYAAKAAGRGRFEFFVPNLGERPRRRLAIEQELRLALARRQLSLQWQPQINLSNWSLRRVEALLRWRHPELGAVGPAEFIPVAEECGLIEEIGNWALVQACREAAGLPRSVGASVNVSPLQLMRPDFVSGVEAALRNSGLPPNRLEIEITESVFINNVPSALANLRQLKEHDIKIALDDFGTGYSSLGYLRHFPFDTLKIDCSFIHELLTRSDTVAIVKSIIGLARTLGIGTVAEGVEDPAQLEMLHKAGCGAIQGFLAWRPMPIAELGALLTKWSVPAAARVSV
jgi:diguanylate cyclase (GGDEF)-like protein/PAS domain S-box-containing protein